MRRWVWRETATNSIGFFFEEASNEVLEDTPQFELIRDYDHLEHVDRALADFIARSLNHCIKSCPIS